VTDEGRRCRDGRGETSSPGAGYSSQWKSEFQEAPSKKSPDTTTPSIEALLLEP